MEESHMGLKWNEGEQMITADSFIVRRFISENSTNEHFSIWTEEIGNTVAQSSLYHVTSPLYKLQLNDNNINM